MKLTGFDHLKYIELQSRHIMERIDQFGGKLYLEFGGKLFDDTHAARVLPGFKPDSKVNMLLSIREKVEVIIVINANDIEKNKVRDDLGITYEDDILRLTDTLNEIGLFVGSVVITRVQGQPAAAFFERKLNALGVKVYHHYSIEGYPSNIPLIVSEDGFGRNDYIETQHPLVVVTAPGPGSGKMATCLSQLYHEHLRGAAAGYAKFETFPIWNLPLTHPVNIAYEAATADLSDVNMIDPFHLEAHGKMAVNYNRDIEIYPVLDAIFKRIYGHSPYQSPTDMGVNMAGFCIIDDDACRRAARDEILRRHYAALCKKRKYNSNDDENKKIQILMQQLSLTPDERPVVKAALDTQELTGGPAAAIQLPDGAIVTGKTSSLLGASAALLLNAVKTLGGIPDHHQLISPSIIEPIQDLKVSHLGNKNPRLHTDEVLIALSICAVHDPYAEIAMQNLENLKDCEVHTTVLLSQVDESIFRKLGVNLTSEARYEINKLYRKQV